MKLIVSDLSSYPEDCSFSRYNCKEDRYICTLNDYWYCEGAKNGECMMCITFDKYMKEKTNDS